MKKRGVAISAVMVAVATSPPASAQEHPAAPIGFVGQWFGQDAYPKAAITAGEQGRVVAILAIDIKGRPTGCTVPTTSGSTTLDAATCRIAMTRVTFTPARDADGRAVAGQYRLPVRWVLPVAAPALAMPPNISVLTQIAVAIDGTVESCTTAPAIPGALNACTAWPVGRRIMAPPRRDGKPVKAHVAISMDIATALDP